MIHYGSRPIPLVVCATCGSVLQSCTKPGCTDPHTIREVLVCGVCTATGGQVVLEEEP
jgi:hypothetical protein